MFGMTLHRYLIVVHGIYLTHAQSYTILAGIWIGIAVLLGVFLPFADLDTFISLQSSDIYCFTAMHRSEPLNVIASLLVLFVVLGVMLFMLYAYYFIVKRYLDLKKADKQRKEAKDAAVEGLSHQGIKSPRLQAKESSNMGGNEIKLLKKAIAIAGSFVCIWSFFAGKIIYEVSNSEPVAVSYDLFIEILFTAYPILNGIILYLYDAKCRNNIQELFYYRSLISRIHMRKKENSSAVAKIPIAAPLNVFSKDVKTVTAAIVTLDTIRLPPVL